MNKSSGTPTHYTYRSCFSLETHAMKLPAHSFSADVNARGNELFSYCISRAPVTFMHHAPQHSVYQVYLFKAELPCFPNASTSATKLLRLDRGEKKCYKLTCCIALQYLTQIQWAHSFTNVYNGRLINIFTLLWQ